MTLSSRSNNTGLHGGASDPLWTSDARVLFRSDRLHEFFPYFSFSYNERINALARLVLYCSSALALVRRSFTPLIVGASVCLLISFSCREEVRRSSVSANMPADNSTQCQMPTKDNPFMNFMPADRPDRPPACRQDDPAVATDIKENFERGLFMGVDDLWGKKNGQRQFYTVDHTSMPNEQGTFARWLYSTGNDRTCKVFPASCPSTL